MEYFEDFIRWDEVPQLLVLQERALPVLEAVPDAEDMLDPDWFFDQRALHFVTEDGVNDY